PMDGLREDAVASLAESHDAQARIEAEIAQAARLAPHDVILDVPGTPVLPEVEARVLEDDGRVVELAQASALTRSLHHAQRDHWRLRVIVPASRREEVGPIAGRILARELS